MTSPQLQYLDLTDFSPGIMQRMMRATTSAGQFPQGAAQETNTYRCISLPGGGLGPLPKRNTAYSLTEQDTAGQATDDGYYHIVGFYPFGPIQSGSPPGSPDELHIGVEWVKSATRKFRWLRMRAFNGTNTIDTIRSIDSTEPTPSTGLYWGMSFCTQRMHPTDVTLPGNPVVATSWAAGGGGYEKFVAVFPDPADADSNNELALSTTRYGTVVGHQNRVVLLEALAYQHGDPPGATGAVPTNEQVSYTDANGMTLGTESAVWMPEFPNGYGAYGSISSGELFLVKQQGGGVLVQGDIADPTVFRLPGVASMGNIGARGASTPIGFLYPTIIGGLWAWRGADVSEKISPQLEDDFFIVSAAGSHQNERVFLAEWNDWCLMSNNWLLDCPTGSFWRIENPSDFTYLHFHRGFNGNFMYAALPRVEDAATQTFAHDFKRSAPATSFSWQSHPLFLDPQDRLINVREAVLTAQGSGTVTVTITDQAGTTLDTLTFTVTSTTSPQRLRKNMTGRNAQHIQVRIQSDSGDTDPAPIVYSLRLGWHQAMRKATS
jgi:hypothetical protein